MIMTVGFGNYKIEKFGECSRIFAGCRRKIEVPGDIFHQASNIQIDTLSVPIPDCYFEERYS